MNQKPIHLSIGDIQMAQVEAAENVVLEGLRAKGLLPQLPFSKSEHHELCLGVMARCYPFVGDDLKQAIREGVESAALLGIPVDCRNLEKGGPLFTGSHA